MLWLVYKDCRNRAGRTILAVLAIAAIIAQILVLEGFLAGTYARLRNAVLRRGGDVIVTQVGTNNFIAARSILPQMPREQVETLDGVRADHPSSRRGSRAPRPASP